MPRQPLWRLLLIMVLSLPGSTWADGDGERAALARRNHEIEALEPLIREAELQADPDTLFPIAPALTVEDEFDRAAGGTKTPLRPRVADRFYIMQKGLLVAGGEMAELGDDLIKQYLTV